MDAITFAAARREQLLFADDRLGPAVELGLTRYLNGENGWASVIRDTAGQIWLEHYVAEAPGRDYDRALVRFREAVGEALSRTTQPTGDVTQAQVGRIVRWLSTYSVNAGTISGAYGRGIRFKRWTTMNDADVREIHEHLDGQIRPIGGTFDVAGHSLPYPAVPVGPPEVWIECRCVAQPASREGETMSATTFTIDPEYEIDEEHEIVSNNITAAADLTNPDGTPYTGALVVLVPADSDPITAASSEPAHVTTVWFGEMAELESRDTPESPQIDLDTLQQEVRQYAAELDGPVVVPVSQRGTLGEDDADVVFLEPTDSLLALRDGLLQNEQIGSAHAAVEQFPEWTPHVTLGYPDRPARAEYDATEVTFDRISLWLGGEHYDYPMGGTVPETITADASTNPVDDQSDLTDAPTEIPPEDEDVADEDLVEIPVHGVATLEGKPTGDGRGFRPGALTFEPLPQPLGYEFEHGHGAANSRVAIVGRVDEYWTAPAGEDGVAEARFRGVIITTKAYAAQAIESIVDGSYNGLSVIVDTVTVDVSEDRAQMIEQIKAEQSAEMRPVPEGAAATESETMSDEEIEALVDSFIGDGTQPVTWFSKANVRRFDMVPTGAFATGYIALGHEFEDEMSDEDLAAAAEALKACGCLDVEIEDVSEDPARNAAAQAAADALEGGAAFRQYDAETRKKMAKNGAAMPDGSFPIADEEDLRNAIQAIGRASDPEAAKAHIKRRAQHLGKTNLIPDGWSLLATGGVIEGGHRALIGGDDSPDYVVPLSAERLMGNRELLAQIARGEFAPGTKDGPGWITHPGATKRIRNYWTKGEGAAKIGWGAPGDFNRCRALLAKYVENPDWLAGLCANMHYEVLKTWPGRQRGDKAHALAASAGAPTVPLLVLESQTTLVASGAAVYAKSAFAEPTETRAFPMRIDREKRTIQGFAAEWGVCHIGIQGMCQEVPRSLSNYRYFRKGIVQTDAGEQEVGLITYGIGHAGDRVSAAAATAHYDQTDAVRAYINIGENAYGVWYSGVLAPWVTDEDIDAMLAIRRVSGDWRNWSGRYNDLEMVGLVVVNTEGFQLAASGGIQTAAIGIGAVPVEDEPLAVQDEGETHAQFVARLAVEVSRYTEFLARQQSARERIHALRVIDARARIERL